MIVRNRDGLLVDTTTGLVIDDQPMDYGPEWRAFDPLEKVQRSRVGAPLTLMLHDGGLASFIDSRDSYGKKVDDAERLRRLAARLRVKGSEGLVNVLRETYRLCRRLGYHHICDDAAAYARRLYHHRPRKRRRSGVVTLRDEDIPLVALYIAALNNGVEPDAVIEEWRALQLSMKKPMKAKPTVLGSLALESGLLRPAREKLVARYVAKAVASLGLDARVQALAERLAAAWARRAQGTLKAIAAAAVYLVGKILASVTQGSVAETLGLTDATIRNTLKRVGVNVVYVVNDLFAEDWSPGRQGLRSADELCVAYGFSHVKHVDIVLGEKLIEVRVECGTQS